MKERTKRYMIASGAAACMGAVAAGAAYLTTRILVKTALDRDEPTLMKIAGDRISGALIDPEVRRRIEEGEQKLLSSHTEMVTITAADGTELVGHWHACPGAKRAVLAMHGWRSSWSRDFGIISDFIYDNQCSVLFAEQRGQNNSGGEYMGFGLKERFDCLDWANWINQRTGSTLPVYFCGISMGATTVLMAAGLDLPDNVRGIISDCGFTSPEEIWRHVARDNLHISYRLHKAMAENMYARRLQINADDYSTLDALSETKTPVLFIHGTDDHFVPVEMTFQNYKVCRSHKKLFVVPGADHGMSYLVDHAGYEQAVKEFWKETEGVN